MGLNIIFTYDVLNEERNDIDDEKLEEHTNGITSKTELRKRFASMSYDIMYEKDIEKETKLDLIRKLNQALEDKINQIEIDPVEEQETAEDLHGKIEHFIQHVSNILHNLWITKKPLKSCWLLTSYKCFSTGFDFHKHSSELSFAAFSTVISHLVTTTN